MCAVRTCMRTCVLERVCRHGSSPTPLPHPPPCRRRVPPGLRAGVLERACQGHPPPTALLNAVSAQIKGLQTNLASRVVSPSHPKDRRRLANHGDSSNTEAPTYGLHHAPVGGAVHAGGGARRAAVSFHACVPLSMFCVRDATLCACELARVC